MKVVILNASDLEGGAARAAYRLHLGLQEIGTVSQMLVQAKTSDDKAVITSRNKLSRAFSKLRPTLNNLPLQFYLNRDRLTFSSQWLADSVAAQIAELNSDIINLHWVCNGYLQIESIAKFAKLNQPLVWTLHDMWAFTGGCHYSKDCERYTDACGACPQLQSSKNWDLSRWIWWRKVKAWKNLNLAIVTPSLWLAKCANSSSLFSNLRVEVIPNGLDTTKYRPISQQVARELLNLPQDKQLVLFGALSATSDPRKGFHLLQPTLQNLSKSGWAEKIELVIFGSSQAENQIDLGFKSRFLGQLNDDISLALVYSAANVTIVPSIQEAFGQTASESLACGTPVVCFDSTGLKDIVEHQQNGYRAKCFSIDDLAQGIIWVLENKERYQKLCDRARQKAKQEFTLELQASRYLSLFSDLAGGNHQKI
jgi:glycosyltransferase involved in cell wall biosynthesis